MPDGKARILALTGAGVLSQVGMTFLIVGLSFGKSPPPAPPQAVQVAAIARPGTSGQATPNPSTTPDADSTPNYVAALPRSRPIHLSVPRVGIETALMELGLEPDGTIQVPPDDSTAPAGWYRNLASPGEVGTAVIVGHLDSPQAPAVFFNLGAMRPGDQLSVTRADGRTANFTVTEVGSYPHDQFPTDAVYGPSPTPVLRLVTCGGPFQRGVGYDGNVVIFATMDQSPGLPSDAPATAPAAPVTATVPSATPATPTAAPTSLTPATPGTPTTPDTLDVTPAAEDPTVSPDTSPTDSSPTDSATPERATTGSSSTDTFATGRNSHGSASSGSSSDVSPTDSDSSGTSARHSEVETPEPRRVSSPTRVPRRVRTAPQPAYVPPPNY